MNRRSARDLARTLVDEFLDDATSALHDGFCAMDSGYADAFTDVKAAMLDLEYTYAMGYPDEVQRWPEDQRKMVDILTKVGEEAAFLVGLELGRRLGGAR